MAGKKYAVSNWISTAEQSETQEIKEMPASRWGVFKAAMGGKGKLFKLMILSLVAAMGAFLGIYFYLSMISSITYLGKTNPFSSNLGIGYPISIGTSKLVALEVLDIKFTFFTLLIPSLLIFGLVLSGLFYVAKKWAYRDENFNISKTFLIGIKKNFINFLIIFLLLGGIIFLFNFTLKAIITTQINSGNNFGLIFSIIVLSILLGLYIIMTLFMCTLAVTYKMNFLKLIKNSFLLTVGSLDLFIRNIIIAVLCFLPLVLFAIPGFSIYVLMFYIFLGIMLTVVGFTVYSHWVFDRVIAKGNSSVSFTEASTGNNDEKNNIIESETKARSVEKAGEEANFSPTTNAANQNRNKKKNFSNPKKRKR